MHIGQFVRQARRKQKISARELSARAGMSASYVSKVENGKIESTTVAFGRIAEALGLSALEVGVAVFSSVSSWEKKKK